MCGIIGVFGHDYVAQDVYDGLVTLQHRGQDAAGIVTFDGTFHMRKAYGLVKDVFEHRHMKRLQGYAGIGHTRYSTIGTGGIEEVQPFFGNAPFGVALAHNGNLFNAAELKEEILTKDHRQVNSNSDGEVLLNLFTKALTKQDADVIEANHIWNAVESVYERAQGGYSVIAYIGKQGMVGFKDPNGIRPLLLGKRSRGLVDEYMFASESCTLDILGYEYVCDVQAGEAIFIDERTREVHRKRIVKKTATPCAFEYVYFARPDSVLSGISVHKSRVRMGTALAKIIKKAKHDIDVVMPVPDSSRFSAFAVADELGLPYREGLVKNRYIGRTFIMPGQEQRKKSIRYKLNPVPTEIEGKNILLIDDSIVRGNTSRQIVQMIKGAGAKKLFFASYAPPVKHANLYGIDIPTKGELIAAHASTEEIRAMIGADALFYGDIEDMFGACVKGNPDIKDLDMSCFDGVYKTGDVDENVLARQERARDGERNAKASVHEEEFEGQLNLL